MNTLEVEKMGIEVSGKREKERIKKGGVNMSKYGIDNGTKHWSRGNTGG